MGERSQSRTDAFAPRLVLVSRASRKKRRLKFKDTLGSRFGDSWKRSCIVLDPSLSGAFFVAHALTLILMNQNNAHVSILEPIVKNLIFWTDCYFGEKLSAIEICDVNEKESR